MNPSKLNVYYTFFLWSCGTSELSSVLLFTLDRCCQQWEWAACGKQDKVYMCTMVFISVSGLFCASLISFTSSLSQ